MGCECAALRAEVLSQREFNGHWFKTLVSKLENLETQVAKFNSFISEEGPGSQSVIAPDCTSNSDLGLIKLASSVSEIDQQIDAISSSEPKRKRKRISAAVDQKTTKVVEDVIGGEDSISNTQPVTISTIVNTQLGLVSPDHRPPQITITASPKVTSPLNISLADTTPESNSKALDTSPIATLQTSAIGWSTCDMANILPISRESPPVLRDTRSPTTSLPPIMITPKPEKPGEYFGDSSNSGMECFNAIRVLFEDSETTSPLAHKITAQPSSTSDIAHGIVQKLTVKELYPEKPFKCTMCAHRFKTKKMLNRHNRVHVKRHTCNQCPYRAAERKSLETHIRVHHTGEKPFPCDQCEHRAATESSLRNHINRFHTGQNSIQITGLLSPSIQKPFKCDQCSYRTSQKDQLVTHIMRNHSQSVLKPFKCDFCDYRSAHQALIVRHTEQYHHNSRDRRLQCPMCPFDTLWQRNLDQHLLAHHSDVKHQESQLDSSKNEMVVVKLEGSAD